MCCSGITHVRLPVDRLGGPPTQLADAYCLPKGADLGRADAVIVVQTNRDEAKRWEHVIHIRPGARRLIQELGADRINRSPMFEIFVCTRASCPQYVGAIRRILDGTPPGDTFAVLKHGPCMVGPDHRKSIAKTMEAAQTNSPDLQRVGGAGVCGRALYSADLAIILDDLENGRHRRTPTWEEKDQNQIVMCRAFQKYTDADGYSLDGYRQDLVRVRQRVYERLQSLDEMYLTSIDAPLAPTPLPMAQSASIVGAIKNEISDRAVQHGSPTRSPSPG